MKGRYGNWELEYKEGDSILIVNETAGVKMYLCKSDRGLYLRDIHDNMRNTISYPL